MNQKIKSYITGIALPAMFLVTIPALLNASEISDKATETVIIMTERLFALLPANTPAKTQAQAIVNAFIDLSSQKGSSLETWINEKGSQLPVIAQLAKERMEDFEAALQGASAEVQAAMDAIFVSTTGKITYEGSNTGVPGVVVIQLIPNETPEGGLLVGMSLTDFQGNYKIIYPGNILALIDGVPDLETRVRPIGNFLPSTPGSWTVAYDADGVMTKAQVQ